MLTAPISGTAKLENNIDIDENNRYQNHLIFNTFRNRLTNFPTQSK